jgi:hypothetical protein
MERTKVESTILLSIGYEPDSELLELEFLSGAIYGYLDVPPYAYMALMESNSKDAYFEKFIHDKYDVEKIKGKTREVLYLA